MQWISPRLTQLVLIAVLLALVGCQSKSSEAQASQPEKSADKIASATAPVSTVPGDTKEKTKVAGVAAPSFESSEKVAPEALEKKLCPKNKTCKIIKTWDAGKDDENQPMQIIELTSDPESAKRAERSLPYYYDEEGQAYCFPIQYWLIRPTLIGTQKPEYQPALILEFCPKGGEFDIYEENEVKIEPGRFSYERGGGMGEKYSETTTVALPSLQHIRFASSSWHKILRPYENIVWEHHKLTGRTSGFELNCEEQDKENYTDGEDKDSYAYQPIPIVALPKAFRADGWKSTSLGSCSSTINSLDKSLPQAEHTGFITHGKPGSAGDAGFQVVMASPTEIYVEVSDDIWVETAGSVLHTDHLELWVMTDIICPKPNKSLFQWGISLNGKVEPFYGKPSKSPTAESVSIQNADGTRTYRFKITLPQKYYALTVVYSDGDDGKTQKRLIATSDVKYRNQFTLGQAKTISAEEGVCEIKNKTLEYVPTMQRAKSPVFEYYR